MDKTRNATNPLGFIPRGLEPWNKFHAYCASVGISNSRTGKPLSKNYLRRVLIYRECMNPAVSFAAKEFAAVWRVKIAEMEGVI